MTSAGATFGRKKRLDKRDRWPRRQVVLVIGAPRMTTTGTTAHCAIRTTIGGTDLCLHRVQTGLAIVRYASSHGGGSHTRRANCITADKAAQAPTCATTPTLGNQSHTGHAPCAARLRQRCSDEFNRSATPSITTGRDARMGNCQDADAARPPKDRNEGGIVCGR